MSKETGQKAKETFDKVYDTTAQYLGKGYNSSKRGIRNMAASFYDDIAENQDRIANPHFYEREITDEMGRKKTVPGMQRHSINQFGDEVNHENSWLRRKANIGKHEIKSGFSNWKTGAKFTGALYGLMAYASDDPSQATSDRMVNNAKYALAGVADVASDGITQGIALGLATFGGPWGVMAGGAITVANLATSLMGYDAGSMVMSAIDYSNKAYDEAKNGTKFNMTQNTAMSLQRQLSNIAMAGSNLGEMMHN